MSLLKKIFLCKLLRWHNPGTVERLDGTKQVYCVDCYKRLDKPRK